MFIQLKNISKIYGSGDSRVEALKHVNIEIEKGEYLAVYGPSGSGKSTLLTIMAGLLHPTEGEVILDEISIYKDLNSDGLAGFRNEYLGYIFQAFNLIPYLNTLENVMLPLAHQDISVQEKRALANAALEKVGLADRATHLPSQLSGGQQQRVAIARAIVNNPLLLFADEPTGNLDSKTRDEILALFSDLNKAGHTILMVTHDLDNIKAAQRYIKILDGVVEVGDKVST